MYLRGFIDSSGTKLKNGALNATATALDAKPRTVAQLWRKHKKSILEPDKYPLDVRRKSGSGRKRKCTVAEVQEKVKAVRFAHRRNFRTLAFKVGIPKSTLHRLLKQGHLQKTRNCVKPILTDANKAQRVAYCESFLGEDGCFNGMMERGDLDEKWWYITEEATHFIIVPGEEAPVRRVKHKSHIIKVMCLTCNFRPRQNPETGEWWDGKIGTWFYVNKVAAQRSSKNRPAGTIESKPFKVTRKEFVESCVKDLLPAIEEKVPAWVPKKLRLQQDNAPPHPPPGTNEQLNTKLAEMATRGWDIQFNTQPPNSPDCNIQDLGFFRAAQSIQHQYPSNNIDELMENVVKAYNDMPLEACKKLWTTAQMVMNEIIRCNGDNTYKLPHANKDKIIRQINRDIPHRIPCMAKLTGGEVSGDVIVAFTNGLTTGGVTGGLAAVAQIVPTPLQLPITGTSTAATSSDSDSVVASSDNSNVDNPPSVAAAASPTTVANDTQVAAPAAMVGNATGGPRDGDEVVEWDPDEEEQEGDSDDELNDVRQISRRLQNSVFTEDFFDNLDEPIAWGGDDYDHDNVRGIGRQDDDDIDEEEGEVGEA